MQLSIISFTERGIALSGEIQKTFLKKVPAEQAIECLLFTKCGAYAETNEDVRFVKKSVSDWAGEQWKEKCALLFIGACGIAVRAVAPHLTDKLHDSPVLVMDEKGEHVIPILSGHMGGANELAQLLAEMTGAKAVITTATDMEQKFAVDLFAKKNKLFITEKAGIARMSAKVLAGEEILVSIEPGHLEAGALPENFRLIDYPPKEKADIVITSEERELDAGILLRPREYIIGMGCKRGKEAKKIEDFLLRNIQEAGILLTQVAAIASISLKKDEPGLIAWSRKERVPFLTYEAEALQAVKGNFSVSGFVKEKTSVDNVCERAALKACGEGGSLVYGKRAEDGMTIAIAKRKWSVRLDEA